MENKYINLLREFANENKGLERITSLAFTGSIFILMSNYLINDMLYRYWA